MYLLKVLLHAFCDYTTKKLSNIQMVQSKLLKYSRYKKYFCDFSIIK